MKIIVSGDYACFTRSEMKVERVSYDVPTISALEGILKSIYWKPSFRYVIKKIVVFNPIKFINIRTNEVSDKLSGITAKVKSKNYSELCLYPGECRSQRSSLVLKDVRYGVEFDIKLTGICNEREREECGNDANKSLGKHYDILQRRLVKGQCYKMPCLGFASYRADVELVDDFDLSTVDNSFKGRDIDLGYMLYRICFKDKGLCKGKWSRESFSDEAYGTYYRPHMIDGVIDVCKYVEEVR